MTLTKKIKDKKVNFEFNKEYIKVLTDKISNNDAIGVRVSKWIAYHGFSININNSLNPYKKIIPCGITDKGVTNLQNISNKKFDKIGEILTQKFIINLKSLNV